MLTKSRYRRLGLLGFMALILLACDLPFAWPWFLPDMDDVNSLLAEPTPTPFIGALAVTPVAELPALDEGSDERVVVGTPISGRPDVINHPQPELTVEPLPFTEAESLGCAVLNEVWPFLGGLTPALPMADCFNVVHYGEEVPPAVFILSCASDYQHRFVIWQDDKPLLINTPEEFQAVFAPVESAEEALSYAIAMTGMDAIFNQVSSSSFRYFQEVIEDTYVIEGPDGYIVHLFDSFICGCGPHTFSNVDVLVMRDGTVRVGEHQPLYEDPEMDGLCID